MSDLSDDDNITDNVENSQDSGNERSSSMNRIEAKATHGDGLTTVRFQHLATDDGHYIIKDEAGQLEHCEDEPITVPGPIQSFGVLMVLQQNLATDELIVRQVSENSTEILGRSPNYLFSIACFTNVLSRKDQYTLRENIDYLPECDTAEATLVDEGPHVFLLSGLGEPGTGNLSIPASRIKPTSRANDKRKEWTCWVAIHRPVQTTTGYSESKAANEGGKTCNIIILEFELEHDLERPLYLPVTGPSTNQQDLSTMSGLRTLDIAPSTCAHAVHDERLSASDDLVTRPTAYDRDTMKTIGPRLPVSTLEKQIMGLDGDELQFTAADVLNSTTSSARPLRALKRMRRTKHLQTQICRDDPLPDRTESKPRNPRHDSESEGIDIMDPLALLAQINEQFSQASDLDSFHKIVVGVIKDLTQFHRCLVYRFDSQWNGLVVAELVDWSKTHDLYNGLQFPSTDIPAQARDLYRINKVRLLYDRTQTTARMVLRSKCDLENPVDMTHCYLRAMSPIHLVSPDVELKLKGRC